jgi:peptidoglycan/xylan/chitin deacetylase (PgdA/CDA1 family)
LVARFTVPVSFERLYGIVRFQRGARQKIGANHLRDQIAEIAAENMLIGSHTRSHPVMSKLSVDEQSVEIESSFAFLSSICKLPLRTYCHPYGDFHSFNDDTIRLLLDYDVDFSFNVESRENDGGLEGRCLGTGLRGRTKLKLITVEARQVLYRLKFILTVYVHITPKCRGRQRVCGFEVEQP